MSLITKITDYFKGAISEMKKVVWPTKKQTIRYSSIVIALSLGVAVFFGILDYVFNLGLEKIIRTNSAATATQIESGDNTAASAPGFSVSDVELGGDGNVQVETTPAYPTKPADPAE